MFLEHPSFAAPEDPDVNIWRYMDFTKFVSILDAGALWFTRADRFLDQFEGSSPKINILARKAPPGLFCQD